MIATRLVIRNAVRSGAALAAYIVAMAPALAASADYPVRPVRIVTSEAGGGNDVQARLVARELSARLGQQVIVENRPSGVIPGDIVAKASPNGYTLLFYNNTLWTAPLIQATPYDPVRDLAPVTTAAVGPNLLVVSPALPVTSVPTLIALAKSKPGELNYASAGTGATNHLAAELFKAMAGVDIVRIGYKGAGPALNDIIANQVQVMFPTASAGIPHMKAGRVKALAVTSREPTAVVPQLPTVASSGLPGYESLAIYGIFVPARTPRPLVERLNREIVRILESAEIRERLFALGMEAKGGAPAELASTIAGEMARMGKVIRAAGIRGG